MKLRSRKKRLQKGRTVHERIFARRLRDAGIPFREQHIVRYYIVDFLIPGKMAVIEIDGSHHLMKDAQRDHDRRRDDFLKTLGFTVFRVANPDVKAFWLDDIRALPDREERELHTALTKGYAARGDYRRRRTRPRPRRRAA